MIEQNNWKHQNVHISLFSYGRLKLFVRIANLDKMFRQKKK